MGCLPTFAACHRGAVAACVTPIWLPRNTDAGEGHRQKAVGREREARAGAGFPYAVGAQRDLRQRGHANNLLSSQRSGEVIADPAWQGQHAELADSADGSPSSPAGTILRL